MSSIRGIKVIEIDQNQKPNTDYMKAAEDGQNSFLSRLLNETGHISKELESLLDKKASKIPPGFSRLTLDESEQRMEQLSTEKSDKPACIVKPDGSIDLADWIKKLLPEKSHAAIIEFITLYCQASFAAIYQENGDYQPDYKDYINLHYKTDDMDGITRLTTIGKKNPGISEMIICRQTISGVALYLTFPCLTIFKKLPDTVSTILNQLINNVTLRTIPAYAETRFQFILKEKHEKALKNLETLIVGEAANLGIKKKKINDIIEYIHNEVNFANPNLIKAATKYRILVKMHDQLQTPNLSFDILDNASKQLNQVLEAIANDKVLQIPALKKEYEALFKSLTAIMASQIQDLRGRSDKEEVKKIDQLKNDPDKMAAYLMEKKIETNIPCYYTELKTFYDLLVQSMADDATIEACASKVNSIKSLVTIHLLTEACSRYEAELNKIQPKKPGAAPAPKFDNLKKMQTMLNQGKGTAAEKVIAFKKLLSESENIYGKISHRADKEFLDSTHELLNIPQSNRWYTKSGTLFSKEKPKTKIPPTPPIVAPKEPH